MQSVNHSLLDTVQKTGTRDSVSTVSSGQKSHQNRSVHGTGNSSQNSDFASHLDKAHKHSKPAADVKDDSQAIENRQKNKSNLTPGNDQTVPKTADEQKQQNAPSADKKLQQKGELQHQDISQLLQVNQGIKPVDLEIQRTVDSDLKSAQNQIVSNQKSSIAEIKLTTFDQSNTVNIDKPVEIDGSVNGKTLPPSTAELPPESLNVQSHKVSGDLSLKVLKQTNKLGENSRGDHDIVNKLVHQQQSVKPNKATENTALKSTEISNSALTFSIKELQGLTEGQKSVINQTLFKSQDNLQSQILVNGDEAKIQNKTHSLQSTKLDPLQLLLKSSAKVMSDQPIQVSELTGKGEGIRTSVSPSVVESVHTQNSSQQAVVLSPLTGQNHNGQSSISSPVAQIRQSLLSPNWSNNFSQNIAQLTINNKSSAEIRLDPPELGSILVKIHHSGSEAMIQFHVQHTEAKMAVDNALDKLREALQQQGIHQVNVDVQQQDLQQFSQQQSFSEDNNVSSGRSSLKSPSENPAESTPALQLQLETGIDLFA